MAIGICPACGYPTIGAVVCAACRPAVAQANIELPARSELPFATGSQGGAPNVAVK